MGYIGYRILLIIFSLTGSLFSGILIWYHNNPSGKSSMVSAICGGQKNTGCSVINHSDLSELFSLPMALWGYIFYMIILSLLVLSFLGKKEDQENNRTYYMAALFYLSALGLIFDLYLGFYSIFILKTICNLCGVTYLATLGLLIITILWGAKMDKDIFKIKNAIGLFMKVKLNLLIQFILILLILSGTGFFVYSQTRAEKHAQSHKESQELEKAIRELAENFQKQKPIEINLADRPFIGNKNARIEIVEFIDPLCPHCRTTTNWLKSYQKKHPKKVKLYQLFYPLDSQCNKNMGRQMHPGACFLSYVQYCSNEQNKFWVFNEWMFQNLEHWYKSGVVPDYVYNNMASININAEKIKSCIKKNKYNDYVIKDILMGEKFDLTGTPTIIVNGRKMPPLKFIYLEMMLNIILEQK